MKRSAWHIIREALEEAPPIPAPQGPLDRPTGTTVQTSAPSDEPIKLTVGKRQLTFTRDEFMEMIQTGQLARMVQSGQVRKLPGV